MSVRGDTSSQTVSFLLCVTAARSACCPVLNATIFTPHDDAPSVPQVASDRQDKRKHRHRPAGRDAARAARPVTHPPIIRKKTRLNCRCSRGVPQAGETVARACPDRARTDIEHEDANPFCVAPVALKTEEKSLPA